MLSGLEVDLRIDSTVSWVGAVRGFCFLIDSRSKQSALSVSPLFGPLRSCSLNINVLEFDCAGLVAREWHVVYANVRWENVIAWEYLMTSVNH